LGGKAAPCNQVRRAHLSGGLGRIRCYGRAQDVRCVDMHDSELAPVISDR
jgi:hypothetical protein